MRTYTRTVQLLSLSMEFSCSEGTNAIQMTAKVPLGTSAEQMIDALCETLDEMFSQEMQDFQSALEEFTKQNNMHIN